MANFLVIAASSSIGQSIVQLLKEAGHNVYTTARDSSKINPDTILDATNFEEMDKVFQKFGELDGVVNCSGSILLKSAHMTTKDQYQSIIDASLTTAFATVRSAGKFLTKGGSVVLISSAAAIEGFSNHEAIAAAKAGIIGLMLSAAATYAPSNLRFNAIAPGLVESNLTTQIIGNPTARKISESMHALGRIGKPMDIARMAEFLLNPSNDWITGQVIAVDGGLSRVRPKNKI